MIYLDYAANHPVDEVALRVFYETERSYPGNPNALHPAGQAAARRLEEVTLSIADLLDAQLDEVIYTSGATEANNLAIKGIAHAYQANGRHILTTPLDHASVKGSLDALRQQGWEIDVLDLCKDGHIDLAQLKGKLRSDTVLLTIPLVDSELGIIQPLEDIKHVLSDYPHCHLHVDATQAIGRIPVSFDGIDTMALTPHKFGGLTGTGLLLKKSRLVLAPQIHGGSSMSIYRSGTPTLALAASTEAALRAAISAQSQRMTYVTELASSLRSRLSAYPYVRCNSPSDSVPHILNLSIEGVKGTRAQQTLAKEGVCVSVKSACSTDGTPSPAVYALCHDRRNALSSWRVSLSHLTTWEEIKDFLQIFEECFFNC